GGDCHSPRPRAGRRALGEGPEAGQAFHLAADGRGDARMLRPRLGLSDPAARAGGRLAPAPGFRRLTGVEPLLRLSFALRASLVRERLQFARNELRRKPVTGVYGLRGRGTAV